MAPSGRVLPRTVFEKFIEKIRLQQPKKTKIKQAIVLLSLHGKSVDVYYDDVTFYLNISLDGQHIQI